jgi:dTMP kinase
VRGAFITLEGTEGVGKSSSLAAVLACLTAVGLQTRCTREPGGTALGEQVREWILHGGHEDLSASVEALLMFAARAQHLQEVVEPSLQRGEWVVCDRFSDATIAYQGGGRGADPQLLQHLIEDVQGNVVPDLTLLLDAPVEVGFARIAGRAHDHFEREGRAFFERVRGAYLDIAAREPERVKIVDATQSPETVETEIQQVVNTFIARFRGAHA